MQSRQWYNSYYFFDDLNGLLTMCGLSYLTKEDKDFLKEFYEMPKKSDEFTRSEVLTGAYLISYYRCKKDSCECKDLFLLDMIAQQENFTPPENPFPIDEENHIPHIWGGAV